MGPETSLKSSISTASSTKTSTRHHQVAVKNTPSLKVSCRRDSKPTILLSSQTTPLSPCISPSRDEAYVVYIVQYLCKGKGPFAVIYRNLLSCNSSDLNPHQSMMHQCLLALAGIYYGVHNHANKVLRDAMRLYGRALSMVNNALSKTNCNVTTEIIVSVFSLCMGEVCVFPSPPNPSTLNQI